VESAPEAGASRRLPAGRESFEGEEDAELEAPPGSRGVVGRIVNLGITLILVAALVYFARDAIPPAWIERFGKVTGLDEIVPAAFHRASVTATSSDFAKYETDPMRGTPGDLPEFGTGSSEGTPGDLTESETVPLVGTPGDLPEFGTGSSEGTPGDLTEFGTGSSEGTPGGLTEFGTGPSETPLTGEDVDSDAAIPDGAGQENTPDQIESVPANPPSGRAVVPSTSGRTFFVNFSPDSALLESDAWHELDSAALLLRQHPDRVALISDADTASGAADGDEELLGSRITAVEQYLQAAGISRQRLRAGERALPATLRGPGDPEAGSEGLDDRFVFISIGSTLPP